MAQARTVTPFMAAIPGIDDRLLRDVGIDPDGNLVDKYDPRVRRLERLGFVEQLVELLWRRRAMLNRHDLTFARQLPVLAIDDKKSQGHFAVHDRTIVRIQA